MGHKVHPRSLRLGITEDWRSHWVADKRHFGEYLVEDQKIRKHTKENYYYAGISRMEISRMPGSVHLTVYCARPGLMIGRRGVEVERLKNSLVDLTGRTVEVSVEEVEQPQLDAQLVAEEVAQQIERRSSFRRAMRRAAEMTMNNGAEGVKIHLAGRLGGSEMARREKIVEGQFPLQTIRAKIDYGFTEAKTKYGHIGVKVWVNTGLLQPGETIKGEKELDDASDA